MSLAKYSNTADSGIDWLGEVPMHWNVVRLRHVAELNPSKSEVSELDRELSVSFLPMEAVGDDVAEDQHLLDVTAVLGEENEDAEYPGDPEHHEDPEIDEEVRPPAVPVRH